MTNQTTMMTTATTSSPACALRDDIVAAIYGARAGPAARAPAAPAAESAYVSVFRSDSLVELWTLRVDPSSFGVDPPDIFREILADLKCYEASVGRRGRLAVSFHTGAPPLELFGYDAPLVRRFSPIRAGGKCLHVAWFRRDPVLDAPIPGLLAASSAPSHESGTKKNSSPPIPIPHAGRGRARSPSTDSASSISSLPDDVGPSAPHDDRFGVFEMSGVVFDERCDITLYSTDEEPHCDSDPGCDSADEDDNDMFAFEPEDQSTTAAILVSPGVLSP